MSSDPERLVATTPSPADTVRLKEDVLIAKYIRPGEKHPISEATIGRTGPTVWRIVRFYHRVDGNLEEVERFWGMQRAGIEAALEYYDRYKEFINARILLEADAPVDK